MTLQTVCDWLCLSLYVYIAERVWFTDIHVHVLNCRELISMVIRVHSLYAACFMPVPVASMMDPTSYYSCAPSQHMSDYTYIVSQI